MPPRWPLLGTKVEVEWRDSYSSGRWRSPEEFQNMTTLGPMRSTGYLLTHSKDRIQLAQSMSSVNGDIADVISIPREAVTRLRKLKGGF